MGSCNKILQVHNFRYSCLRFYRADGHTHAEAGKRKPTKNAIAVYKVELCVEIRMLVVLS